MADRVIKDGDLTKLVIHDAVYEQVTRIFSSTFLVLLKNLLNSQDKPNFGSPVRTVEQLLLVHHSGHLCLHILIEQQLSNSLHNLIVVLHTRQLDQGLQGLETPRLSIVNHLGPYTELGRTLRVLIGVEHAIGVLSYSEHHLQVRGVWFQLQEANGKGEYVTPNGKVSGRMVDTHQDIRLMII